MHDGTLTAPGDDRPRLGGVTRMVSADAQQALERIQS
jgi:hypothetical protein